MAFAVNKMSLRSNAASKRSVAANAKTTKGTTSNRGGAAVSNIDYLKSLPGVSQPFPDVFDPANLSATASVKDLRRWRESELVHGRISMLAALGFVVQENIEDNTAFFPFAGKITGPAIYHFQQIKQGFWEPLLILIGIAEAYRVAYGWAPPVNGENFNALREDYDMGDLGFDPLGLKPKDPEALKDLQTKELNNGRLAMIAVAGFVGQELLFQHEVLNWGGFQQSLAEAPVDPSTIKPPPLPVEFPDRGVPNIKDIRVPTANDVKDAVNYSSGKGFLSNFSTPSGGEVVNKAQELKSNLPSVPNPLDGLKNLASNLPSGGEVANKAQEAKNSLPGGLPSGGEIANKAQELKNTLPGLPSFSGFKAGVEDAANNLPSGQDVADKAVDIKDSLPSFNGFKTSLAQGVPSGGELANKAQEAKNSLPSSLPSGGEIVNKAQDIKNNLPGLPSFGGFKAGVEDAANNLPSGQDVANKAGDIIDSLPSFSGFKAGIEDAANSLPSGQDVANKTGDIKDSLPSFNAFKTSLAQGLPSGGELANKAQEAKNSLPGGLPSGGEISNKVQELKNNLPDLPSLPSLSGFKTDLADNVQDVKDSLPSTQDVKNALPNVQDIFDKIPDVPTPQVSVQDVRTPGTSY